MADQRRRGVEPENHQRQLTAREIDIFGRGGVPQQGDDLLRRHLFRVKQVVDPHVDENLLVVGPQVLVVVDAGDRLFRPELFGQRGREDIGVFLRSHGHEQVAALHLSPLEAVERCDVPLDGQHVRECRQFVEPFFVVVDDRDVVVFVAEHLHEMAAHLAGPGDEYFHVCSGNELQI